MISSVAKNITTNGILYVCLSLNYTKKYRAIAKLATMVNISRKPGENQDKRNATRYPSPLSSALTRQARSRPPLARRPQCDQPID